MRWEMRRFVRLCVCVALLCVGCGEGGEGEEGEDRRVFEVAACPGEAPGERGFAEAVVSFAPGAGAGYGEEAWALGAPMGGERGQGSLDVLSLGAGGEVVVELGVEVVDCPGPDFAVFENAFRFGEVTYAELGEVSVSLDGVRWFTFGCDVEAGWPWPGCAGVGEVAPVGEGAAPEAAGGDRFDLASVGVARARYVRIRDLQKSNGPSGPPSRGFDLDGVAVFAGHAEAIR